MNNNKETLNSPAHIPDPSGGDGGKKFRMDNLMNVKILLPFKVFAHIKNVSSIVMETSEGSYGLLPQRLDCVAALVPGIFTYEREGVLHYVAVDNGVMVKAGREVLVSVRNAVGGGDLGKLGELVKKKFTSQDENQEHVINVIAKLERGFVYSFDKLRNI